MTPAEIAALRALCDAATPGPWRVEGPGGGWGDHAAVLPQGEDALSIVNSHASRAWKKDAAFIAAARTAVPALLSALEEARARTEEMEKSKWYERDRRKEADARADALQAEVRLLTHKVITCGVAASHPDASLSTRVQDYGGPWDSPQAQEVRDLRARADAAWRVVEAAGALVERVRTGGMIAFGTLDDIRAALRAIPPPSATPNEET